jgi:hypothetical protein
VAASLLAAPGLARGNEDKAKHTLEGAARTGADAVVDEDLEGERARHAEFTSTPIARLSGDDDEATR